MKKVLIYTIILCSLGFTKVNGQEMKAKKYDNPQWKSIGFIKFKPGKVDRAKEIIKNYFVKASEKSSTPVPMMAVDLVTGEWDMMVVWDMKGGVEDLNWEVSPDDVKWMGAVNELAGGADKGKGILAEFSDLIMRENRYLGKSSPLK